MIFRSMFSSRWVLTTLLVVAGTLLCIRLGIWQLDRLEQRRAFNAHFEAMTSSPTLEISGEDEHPLTGMEYRSVVVKGTYDFSQQIALRNQYFRDQLGYHLLTPLVLENGVAILVDRGWIPSDGNDTPQDWRKYDDTTVAEVNGIIRASRATDDLGRNLNPTPSSEQPRIDFWYLVNIDQIQSQITYKLLPVYIQLDVEPDDLIPPVPYQPEVEITEGPHMGYALQWFTFASILFFGYPFYLRNQLKPKSEEQA